MDVELKKMNGADDTSLEAILEQIRVQAEAENIRITQHAQREMVEEDITLDEVLEAITTGHILENYPEHPRELVVCSTVLQAAVVLYISCVRRRGQCLSSLRSMNLDHQSG